MARRVGLFLGPCLAVLILGFDLEPGRPLVTRTAAVAAWMAAWWLTEAVPLAVTALLPMVLFPALGVLDARAVAREYMNDVIFLFVGGFLVALALERWRLHRRIALRILLLFGTRPRRILLGFMVATAALSMWVSNTATAMMMVTIALALIVRVEEAAGERRPFAVALLLGVAYGASIGGVATPVGTPPNLAFLRILHIEFPHAPPVTFTAWMLFAVPLSAVFLLCVWAYLSWFWLRGVAEVPLRAEILREEYRALGRLSFAERAVLLDFLALVFLWLFRADLRLGFVTLPGWARLFPAPEYLRDGVAAVAMASLLFVLPARDGRGGRLLDWETAQRLPWGIVLLFGGGFALAAAFKSSGLAAWLGERLTGAGALPPLALAACITLGMTFVTELTSNTATTQMMLPVVAGLAVALRVHPLFLMVPVTVASSCAFMMPVATPPNAIVFGSDRLRVPDMAWTGLWLNFVATGLILGAVLVLGRWVWGIHPGVFPPWAVR